MNIKVNGFQLHYEERGSGEPLLLLHGGSGIGSDWQLVFPWRGSGRLPGIAALRLDRFASSSTS